MMNHTAITPAVRFGRFSDAQQERLDRMHLETYTNMRTLSERTHEDGAPRPSLREQLETISTEPRGGQAPKEFPNVAMYMLKASQGGADLPHMQNLLALDEWTGDKADAYAQREEAFITDIEHVFRLMGQQMGQRTSALESKETVRTFLEVLLAVINRLPNYEPSDTVFSRLIQLIPPKLGSVTV